MSLTKKAIIKSALKFQHSDSHNNKWRLKDNSLISFVHSIPSVVDDIEKLKTLPDVEVVKHESRRILLRINSHQTDEKTFVVKIFPLFCLRHRLKYHVLKYDRFAFGEAANLLIAAERGLNVPKVYGYGSIYDGSLLIKQDVLILQDLAPRKSVGQLLEINRTDREKCSAILGRAIPFFDGLYRAKCNNIGLNVGAIMLGGQDSGSDDYILDFEYAKFHSESSPEMLMFQAAHFAKYCCKWVTKETMNQWLEKLLDVLEIKDDTGRKKMIDYFEYYFSTKLSRKQRQKIGI